MDDDTVSFDSIAGSEDDQLDPLVANTLEDAIFSAADPDDLALTQDLDEES